MPRYTLEALVTILALCAIAYSQAPVEHFRPRPAPVAPHNFGVDEAKLGRGPIDINFPFPFIEAVNQWATMPERIERALTWTTFGIGFACGAFVSAGWILAVTRAQSNRNT